MKSSKTLHSVQLHSYLVPRNVDGPFLLLRVYVSSGLLLSAHLLSLILFPQTPSLRASLLKCVSTVCVWTHRHSSSPRPKGSLTARVTPRQFPSSL